MNECGDLLNMGELLTSLQDIVNESHIAGPPIGILTTEYRNNWEKAHRLLTIGMSHILNNL